MKTITSILSSTIETEGIKTINIFFDTVVLNFKSLYEYVLIDKLIFDDGILKTENKGYIIEFGNTGSTSSYTTSGNCYIDTFLLEKEKQLFICGLSCFGENVSITVDSVPQSGLSYIPIVYKYDINNHELHKVLPNSTDFISWSAFPFGSLLNSPKIYMDNNILKYYFFTRKSVNEEDLVFMNILSLEVQNNILQLKQFDSLSSTNIDVLPTKAAVSFSDKNFILFQSGEALIPTVIKT